MLKRNNFLLTILFSIFCITGWSQELIEIEGKVVATEEVEGIHILNETSSKFTVTNENGFFIILGKLGDTIVVSSIKFQPKRVRIENSNIQNRKIEIELVELVNQLETVTVGKVLAGDLVSDLENTKVEMNINFYDLGIHGYTGRKKTIAERRLYEATSGSGLIPLNPIINAITGRTKQLKEQLRLRTNDKYMDLAKSKFSVLLFEEGYEAHIINQFFYFASDDDEFLRLSKLKNDFNLLDFLIKKKTIFLKRLKEKEDD